MENCFEMERSQSLRLREKMLKAPTENEIVKIRTQVDFLKLKLAQADTNKVFNLHFLVT